MPSEIDDPAETRIQVYPPDQVVTRAPTEQYEGANAYLKQHADMELILALQRAGLNMQLAILYVQLLWRAGSRLDHCVASSILARDTGRRPAAISRSLTLLKGMGLIETVKPESRPAQWRFPKYAELLARVNPSLREEVLPESNEA